MTGLTQQGGTDLRSLATEINREHRAITRTGEEMLNRARRAGELLAEAKAGVEHGGWMGWVEEHFSGSYRTAALYMRIYRRWDEVEAKLQRVAGFGLREADRLLAEPRESEDDEPTDEPASHDTEPTDEPDAGPEPENQGEARNDDPPRDSGEGDDDPFAGAPTMGEVENARRKEKEEKRAAALAELQGGGEADAGAAGDEDDGKVVDLDEHRDTRTQKEWVDDEKDEVKAEVEESVYGRMVNFLGHIAEAVQTFDDDEIAAAVAHPEFPANWIRDARHVRDTLDRIIQAAPTEEEDHASA